MSSRARSESRYSRRRRDSSLDRDDRHRRHGKSSQRDYSPISERYNRRRRSSSPPMMRQYQQQRSYPSPVPPVYGGGMKQDYDPCHYQRKYQGGYTGGPQPPLEQFGQPPYGYGMDQGYGRPTPYPYNNPPPPPIVPQPPYNIPQTIAAPIQNEPTQTPLLPAVVTGPACPFCDEKNVEFSNKKKLKKHFAEFCPCLHRCRFCNRAIEICKLQEHYLGKCPWLKDTLKTCPKCGQACSEEEMKKHERGANCHGIKPLEGGVWCSLCDSHVNDTQESWRKHLIGPGGCAGNTRKLLSGIA